MAKTKTKFIIFRINRWSETDQSANGEEENRKSANKNIKIKETYSWRSRRNGWVIEKDIYFRFINIKFKEKDQTEILNKFN